MERYELEKVLYVHPTRRHRREERGNIHEGESGKGCIIETEHIETKCSREVGD
jgi:hypothetical protein